MNEEMKSVVIIYHAHCYDGFGAVWAGWKKFGNNATYLACSDRDTYPQGVKSKDVYVLDFCFNEEITKELVETNNTFVILDHHSSTKHLVERIPKSVFSDIDSGAKIAWKYFHPTTDVPALIEYISDSDTWAHVLPHYREVESYIHVFKLEFADFDILAEELETKMETIIEKGKILIKQFENLVQEHIDKAMLVKFEGYEVYAVNASSFLRSELGHRLAVQKGPFAIVYRFEQDTLKVSLRGDGSIDCTTLVAKYGGGGHHNAAAFALQDTQQFPFKRVE